VNVLAASSSPAPRSAVAERRRATRTPTPRMAALDANLLRMLPLVTFIALARLHISAGVGVGIGLIYVELAIVTTLALVARTRVFALHERRLAR